MIDRLQLQQKLVEAIGLADVLRARAVVHDPGIVEPLERVLSILADVYSSQGFDPEFLKHIGETKA